MKKTVYSQNVVEAAAKAENALCGQGKGLRITKLALLLRMPVSVLYNAVASSSRICEDDDGRLYYVDWKTR